MVKIHEELTPREIEYRIFARSNPQVLDTMERLAQEWMQYGLRPMGNCMLWELARWKTELHTTGDQGFKLNDKFRSRFIRALLKRHPEWKGYIKTRRLRS